MELYPNTMPNYHLQAQPNVPNILSINTQAVCIDGSITSLIIEGDNNNIALIGAIQNFLIKGNNNSIRNSCNIIMQEFHIWGQNNTVYSLSTAFTDVIGHYNTLIIIACPNINISGNGNRIAYEFQNRPEYNYQSYGIIPRRDENILANNQSISSYGMSNQPRVSEQEIPLNPRVEQIEMMEDVGRLEITHEMQEKVFGKFPLHQYRKEVEKSEECTICLEKFQNGEEIRTFSCKHAFHGRCLDNWLSSDLSCPNCRLQLI